METRLHFEISGFWRSKLNPARRTYGLAVIPQQPRGIKPTVRSLGLGIIPLLLRRTHGCRTTGSVVLQGKNLVRV